VAVHVDKSGKMTILTKQATPIYGMHIVTPPKYGKVKKVKYFVDGLWMNLPGISPQEGMFI
jgi:hypothetical protein